MEFNAVVGAVLSELGGIFWWKPLFPLIGKGLVSYCGA